MRKLDQAPFQARTAAMPTELLTSVCETIDLMSCVKEFHFENICKKELKKVVKKSSEVMEKQSRST